MFNEKLFDYLINKNFKVKYVNSYEKNSDVRILFKNIDSKKN